MRFKTDAQKWARSVRSYYLANKRVWKQEADKARHLTKALVFWTAFQSGRPSSNLGQPVYVTDK
jgi:hypothetical protein